MVTLRLEGAAGSLSIGEDDIQRLNPTKTHTGLADIVVEIAGRRDVEAFAARQDKLLLDVASGTEFIGYLTDVSHNKQRGTTRLRGEGIAKRLKETRPDYDALGGSLTYTNISVQEALRDYWPRTPFSNVTVYNQNTEVVADDQQVQEANTNAEWSSITNIADTDPVVIQNDNLELAQTSHFVEAEDESTNTTVTNTDFSSGEGVQVADGTDDISFNFTIDYTAPADSLSLALRYFIASGDQNPAFDLIIDGEIIASIPADAVNTGVIEWRGDDGADALPRELSPGTYTAELDSAPDSATTGNMDVDCLAVFDSRYTSSMTFDNTVDANDALSGPEPYPGHEPQVEFSTVNVSFNIGEATAVQTWNNTENAQQISLSNDGGTTYQTESNTQNSTQSFVGAGRQARARVTLDRYDTVSTTSPTSGDGGQLIQDYTLTVDGDNLAVIDELELSRNHFDNLQTLHDYGEFVFNIEHDDLAIGNLVVESFRRGEQTRALPFDEEIDSTPEISGRNYYNTIFLQGALVGGTRPTAEVQDSTLVSQDGREISPGVLRDQNVVTESGALFRARSLLDRATMNNALRGRKTYPAEFSLQPGYAYATDFGNGEEEFTAEDVSLSLSTGGATTTVNFVPRQDLAADIKELRQTNQQIGDRV